MKADLFEAPDYYLLDDLLSEEHKLVRSAARDWVKRDVSPIIEDYAQRAEFEMSAASANALCPKQRMTSRIHGTDARGREREGREEQRQA